MSVNGLDVFAAALWKARNHADPAQDVLAKHLMLQELDQLQDEARGVVEELYAEGYAIVGRDLSPETIQLVLKDTLTRFRDPDITSMLSQRLRELYLGALKGNEKNLDHPMIRSLLAAGLSHQAEKRRPGEPVDRRIIEKATASICGDLHSGGFAIIPKEPPKDALQNTLQRGSKLALVFGDDPANVVALYRQMVGRQRLS